MVGCSQGYSSCRHCATRWDSVGIAPTCGVMLGDVRDRILAVEDFGQRVSQIAQCAVVKADLGGLSGAVKGPKLDTGRNAVDDRLIDLNAGFAVLRGNSEGEVDDVGLYFLNSHVEALSCVCMRTLCVSRAAVLLPSLSVYIIPLFAKKTTKS